MAKEDFEFFWGGVYSQWCPMDFVIDGVVYNCCEQYMMAKKALLFGDYWALAQIMESNQPSEQKQFGRKVRGFDKAKWELYCRKYVYDANYAKFTQTPVFREALLKSVGKEIVEASPEDPIWGIGLKASDERAWDKSTWLGTNWLGEAIMEVRSALLLEQKQS